ncbi:MAG TPA: 4a-hydroxytetrahydrobiopterin dehydratase [Longimicrobiales bacterium]|nr:4a-hydroxytetrahydrobiopterin dehydratase [Longimicrobiales bacterium]
MEKLDGGEIERRLARLPGWERRGEEIRKSYTFPAFSAALDFVARVGERAEAADHHPDMDIRYTRVDVALSTHSAGGLTEKDFALAAEIEALGQKATGGMEESTGGNPLV